MRSDNLIRRVARQFSAGPPGRAVPGNTAPSHRPCHNLPLPCRLEPGRWPQLRVWPDPLSGSGDDLQKHQGRRQIQGQHSSHNENHVIAVILSHVGVLRLINASGSQQFPFQPPGAADEPAWPERRDVALILQLLEMNRHCSCWDYHVSLMDKIRHDNFLTVTKTYEYSIPNQIAAMRSDPIQGMTWPAGGAQLMDSRNTHDTTTVRTTTAATTKAM